MSRQPFTGSCHCGKTRFLIYLTLPHTNLPEGTKPKSKTQRIYRCNCSVCHKSGIFHVRTHDFKNDFLLFSPTDPEQSLGDYRCNEGRLGFYFCKSCGGRCFSFAGASQVVKVKWADLGVSEEQKKRLVKGDEGSLEKDEVSVWKVVEKDPSISTYLSINGHAIDQQQDGWDMAAFTKGNQVLYLDLFRHGEPDCGEATLTKPFPQGSF